MGGLQRTEGHDVRTVPPAVRAPVRRPSAPFSAIPPRRVKGLPPAAATPSTPATGQLLSTLPIPIWVYEDGRVISARWTTHNDWTGFLKQRLTPEGVELVRAEILALEPVENCRYGLGNYGYGDGSRTVCESPGARSMYSDDPQYLRLSELQYGAPSWLPASAWLDPEPKPYVPSTYQIQISTMWDGDQPPPPIDPSALLAALPPEAAELLTVPTQCPVGPGYDPNPNTMLCFKVRTEEARQVGTVVGITEPSVNEQGDSGTPMGGFGSYFIGFLPYLPHEAPVGAAAVERMHPKERGQPDGELRRVSEAWSCDRVTERRHARTRPNCRSRAHVGKPTPPLTGAQNYSRRAGDRGQLLPCRYVRVSAVA